MQMKRLSVFLVKKNSIQSALEDILRWYRVILASHNFGLGQGLAEVSNGQIEYFIIGYFMPYEDSYRRKNTYMQHM